MSIPTFKSSAIFIDDIALPCLAATEHNSSIPGLATREVVRRKKSPKFGIFLRGEVPGKVSAWQKGVLERLFEKGELSSAIVQGMKEYENNLDEADMAVDAESWKDIKQNGVLPHVILLDVVIDEIEKQVILSLATSSIGNLDEHGIAIALKGNRWRFHQGDYLIDYCLQIETAVEEDRWVKLYPPPPGGVPIETDASFLYGTWEFDKQQTEVLLERLGVAKREITERLQIYKSYRFEISRRAFKITTSPWNSMEGEFIGVEKRGHTISIRFRLLGKPMTRNFVLENNLLKMSDGLVLKQTATGRVAETEVESAGETEASFIFGRWVFDPRQTELLLRGRGASETRIKVELQKMQLFGLEVSESKFQITVPDGRGGSRSMKMPFGKCEKRGDKVTINGEEYYHQQDILAPITPSVVVVLRRAGSKEGQDVDVEKVLKLFSKLKTKPGL